MKPKKFCPTHCFNYNGVKCPFCEKDRIHNLTRRFYKESKTVENPQTDGKEITINDLDKLKLKFQGQI